MPRSLTQKNNSASYTVSCLIGAGRSGHLWHEDQFDHLVGSEASNDRIQRYIIDNPAKAKLRCGDYRVYVWAKF